MRTVSIDIDVEYILHFLEDELREEIISFPSLRIHPVAPSTTRKAADMPQDYDPDVGQVHLNRGVRIRAGSREFFFPATWIKQGKFELIRSLAQEVRDYCSANQQ